MTSIAINDRVKDAIEMRDLYADAIKRVLKTAQSILNIRNLWTKVKNESNNFVT